VKPKRVEFVYMKIVNHKPLPVAAPESTIDYAARARAREEYGTTRELGMIAALRGRPCHVTADDVFVAGWNAGRKLRMRITDGYGLRIIIDEPATSRATDPVIVKVTR
jgi:hypothetical protein